MNKEFLFGIVLVVLILAAASVKVSSAAFLVVDEDGRLVWQVLSRGSDEEEMEEEKVSQEKKFEVEVRTTNRGPGKETGQEVRIRTEEGRVKLRVATPSGQTEMDVTELKDDIVKIRERRDKEEIKIRARDGRLEIRQKGIGALTHFPVNVNPETNELTVITPSGTRIVGVLPSVAVANILQSNIMDRVLAARGLLPSNSPGPEEEREATEEAEVKGEKEQEVELVEEGGKLAFKIEGVKNVRFLNLFTIEAPVLAFVSAQTGETLRLERPFFLTFFGFLFSQ